jgi:hypothetical protein
MPNELVARNGIISLGSLTLPYKEVNENYTITNDDYILDVSGNTTITISLPDSSSIKGKVFIIKNSSTNNVTIDPFESQKINGETTRTLYGNKTIQIVSTNTDWIIIGSQTNMFQETVSANTGNTLTQVVSNGGNLPSNPEQVMLYEGGSGNILAPIHPDDYTINDPTSGVITLSWTPEPEKKFLIIWYDIL